MGRGDRVRWSDNVLQACLTIIRILSAVNFCALPIP